MDKSYNPDWVLNDIATRSIDKKNIKSSTQKIKALAHTYYLQILKEIFLILCKENTIEKKKLYVERTNQEIAKELDIAISTVKTHKSRAYKILRKKLNGLILFFLFIF